jgi:glycosyltransferase involved in cell wall biosynthesis
MRYFLYLEGKVKKALIVTTISGFVPQFEMNSVCILKALGYEVHYATNYNNPFYGYDNSRLENTGIIQHQVDFVRSPFSFKCNIIAYKQLKSVIHDIKPDILHCHTPMAGVIARLLAKKEKVKTVIYTAHGFHFYKGAPIKNWLLYYPVEYYLSKYTDILITINTEDYERAKKRFKAKTIKYIPGVGVDVKKIYDIQVDYYKKRKSIGLTEEDVVICSVGELNKNKNHEIIIRALHDLKVKDVYYIICGKGENEGHLRKISAMLGMEDKIRLLGYRDDVIEILKISDIFAFPSKREGLGLAALEAMACGLPLVASNIHGIRDYLINGVSGYSSSPTDVEGFKNSFKALIDNKILRKTMKENNLKEVQKFDKISIQSLMRTIYEEVDSLDYNSKGD